MINKHLTLTCSGWSLKKKLKEFPSLVVLYNLCSVGMKGIQFCLQVSVTSYLQTVCLAAGMRVCPEDIHNLVTQCKGDMRHSLLSLQYLILSGGGGSKEPRPLSIRPTGKTVVSSEKTARQGRDPPSAKLGPSAARDGNKSGGEFVSFKLLRKRPRIVLDEDDSDTEVPNIAGAKAADTGVISADALPLVHLNLHESLLGVSTDLSDVSGQCVKVRGHKRPDEMLIMIIVMDVYRAPLEGEPGVLTNTN